MGTPNNDFMTLAAMLERSKGCHNERIMRSLQELIN